MINGERCTRACGFCQVDTRHPLPLSPDEPERVAQAVERMRLGHAVVTCVARDDLPDGGAGAMAETIRAIRSRTPGTTVEVLISDCRGDAASLDAIFEARPDMLNHNIETVARLQRAVRPSAGYARSLAVLARAGQAGLVTKSGLMVGLGEREDEVVATMADLRGVGVSIVTIGQYLRPSRDHLPVSRYWTPEEFDRLRDGRDGARRGPRRGVAAHPVELSRPRGGHGCRASLIQREKLTAPAPPGEAQPTELSRCCQRSRATRRTCRTEGVWKGRKQAGSEEPRRCRLMDVQFVTSIAPIVRDAEASRSFYAEALGLRFEGHEGDYVFTHELAGTKHFGLWPLSEAANACFGTTEWPTEIPAPQASIEFEVADAGVCSL